MPDGMTPALPTRTRTTLEPSAGLIFSSTDVDETSSVLNRLYYPLSVGVTSDREAFGCQITVIQLGPLTIGRLGFGAPVTLIAAELDGYHVTIPSAGSVQTRHAGHDVVVEAGVGAIFGPGRSVHVRYGRDAVELNVKISRPALENELAALIGRPVTGPLELPPSIDLGQGAASSWHRLIQLLSTEPEDPASLVWQPMMAEHLRRSVLNGLLLSVRHRFSDELSATPPSGPPRAVRRVIDAIHDEPERPFSVGELAAIAGLSVRSLQESFRRYVGCAPMAYLQSVRLTRAHETLLQEDPTRVTVAAVAHRSGFAHLGRFATAYRVRFGVRPSETLRQGT